MTKPDAMCQFCLSNGENLEHCRSHQLSSAEVLHSLHWSGLLSHPQSLHLSFVWSHWRPRPHPEVLPHQQEREVERLPPHRAEEEEERCREGPQIQVVPASSSSSQDSPSDPV